MPVAVPMKFRMSRTLAFGPKLTTGSGAVGLRSGVLGAPRLFAQLCRSRGFGRVGFDAIANRLFELDRPRRGQTVRRVELQRAPVFEQRRIELILRFELVRAADVLARGILRRPLERDLVFRACRVSPGPPSCIRDGGVPVADPRRLLPLAEGAARRAPETSSAENDDDGQPVLQHRHSIMKRPFDRAIYLPTHSWPDMRIVVAAASVDVFHDDRFDADPHEPILPGDDLPFAPAHRRAAIAERRHLPCPGPSSRSPMYFNGIGGGGGGPLGDRRSSGVGTGAGVGRRLRRRRRGRRLV